MSQFKPMPGSSIKENIQFILKNYKQITGKDTGGEDPKYHPEITKIIKKYNYNKDEFYKVWNSVIKFYIP